MRDEVRDRRDRSGRWEGEHPRRHDVPGDTPTVPGTQTDPQSRPGWLRFERAAPYRGAVLPPRFLAGLATALLGSVVALTGCTAPADEHDGHDTSSMETGIAVVEGGPDTPYRGLAPTEPFPRPAFTLTDTDGAPYDFMAQTSGELTLLFFGFTNCADVCPTTMANVAVALRNVDRSLAEEVNVVFVTTDPARDDPATLGAYLERFDADLPVSFVGLTGDRAAVEAAQSAAGVPVAEDNGETHSTLLLLFGRDDVARVAFLAGSVPDDITHDLEIIAEQ